MPTKLIEVALPLDVINREAAREKSIRQGHPSTLHLWWARRPLAACRAVLFAQLVDDPSAHPEVFPSEAEQDRERRRLFRILERLVPWEAASDESVLDEARSEIRRCYPAGPPTVVDPFCGGGSIPLEAQRLGLEAHASDLNPVAVLMTKALVELAPKFIDRAPVRSDSASMLTGISSWRGVQGLAEDVRHYGKWIEDAAESRLGHLYPKPVLADGSDGKVIAWIWARTVQCPNPACRSEMPLVRTFWLGKKKGKEVWVRSIPDPASKRLQFEIGHGKEGPPIDGTIGRSGAVCIACHSPVPLTYIRDEGKKGRMTAQLMAVVAEGQRERMYLAPTSEHERAGLVSRPADFPETELPHNPRDFNTPSYGITHHADLFTGRQLTLLCTLADLVGEAHELVLRESGGDIEYSDTVATFLAFLVDRMANENSTVCTWANAAGKEHVRSTFARQAIPMTWDYAEPWPFTSSTGGFAPCIERVVNVILRSGGTPGVVVQKGRSTVLIFGRRAFH